MKYAKHLLALCCLSAIVAGAAFAQPGTDAKKDPKATHPKTTGKPGAGEQPKGEMPAGMPSMDDMMKMCEEAARPNEMHAWMVSGAGTWEGKCRFWMDPSQEKPQESTCTTTLTSIMDGRFVRNETKGTMTMGDKTVPFEGFGVSGYNTETKQFEQTWCDNMGTMLMHSTGKLSDDKKTLTWEAKFQCPMMHKETWMRQVQKWSSPDNMVLEFWAPDMTGKSNEYKMGEITYTRKAGTAPKPMKMEPKTDKPATTKPSGH